MNEMNVFSGNEARALRRLVDDGIADFETQVKQDPRMLDHIADGDMSLDDYRRLHAAIAEKLHDHDSIDYRLFDRDETLFIAHLAEEGSNVGSLLPDTDPKTAAREWQDRLIAKAEAMDEERRATDFTTGTKTETMQDQHPQRTYRLATLQAAANRLAITDWDAHRKLAQIAVESGYAAELSQEFNNDDSDPAPLKHSIRFLPPSEIQPRETDSAGLGTEFDAMGGTVEVEQFTPDRPHGDYGPKTPFDVAPINADEPSFPQPSNAHMDALASTPPAPQTAPPSPGLV